MLRCEVIDGDLEVTDEHNDVTLHLGLEDLLYIMTFVPDLMYAVLPPERKS